MPNGTFRIASPIYPIVRSSSPNETARSCAGSKSIAVGWGLLANSGDRPFTTLRVVLPYTAKALFSSEMVCGTPLVMPVRLALVGIVISEACSIAALPIAANVCNSSFESVCFSSACVATPERVALLRVAVSASTHSTSPSSSAASNLAWGERVVGDCLGKTADTNASDAPAC